MDSVDIGVAKRQLEPARIVYARRKKRATMAVM
jgi:hypothetical protein